MGLAIKLMPAPYQFDPLPHQIFGQNGIFQPFPGNK
jgi:hypothetical protein